MAHERRWPAFRAEAVGICLETLLDDPWRCGIGEFERIVRASAGAGFRSVGLWSDRAFDLGCARVGRILDDGGLHARLVEVRTRWAEGPEAAVEGVAERLDQAAELGAEMVLAVSQQTSIDLPKAADGFAALCEMAAERDLRVTIEFLPVRAVCDLAAAWAVVGGSGATNGGIDIDLMHWHHQPAGPDLDLLSRIPGARVHSVQVCDTAGQTPSREDYVATAIRSRLLPGDGDVDIAGVFDVLQATGADPFLAMEVFSSELLSGGPEQMARRVRSAAEEMLS